MFDMTVITPITAFFPPHYRHFLFTVRVFSAVDVFFLAFVFLLTFLCPKSNVHYIYDNVLRRGQKKKNQKKQWRCVQQNVLWQRILHNSIGFQTRAENKRSFSISDIFISSESLWMVWINTNNEISIIKWRKQTKSGK